MSTQSTKIDAATLAKLNHTDNIALRQYREKYKKHSCLMFFKDIIEFAYKTTIQKIAGADIVLSYARRSPIDKYWLIMLLKEYKKNLILAEGKGKKIPFNNNNYLYPIDAKIAKAIFALNNQGIDTKYCCEGGQERGHSYSVYITLDYNKHFPDSLINKLNESKVNYELCSQKIDNPYENGPALYARSTKEKSNHESNNEMLSALEDWADEQGVPDLNVLKHQWKYK